MDRSQVEHSSCVGMLTTLARNAPKGVVHDVASLRVADTGCVVPLFNAVLARDEPMSESDVEAVLDGAAEAPERLTFWQRRGIDVDVDELLSEQGMQVIDTAPGMVAALPLVTDHIDDVGVELTTVDGDEAVEAHTDLMVRSFGIPADALATFTGPGLLTDESVIVALAAVEGRPVSTALGVMVDETVCLFNVATPPQDRGRGFGAAVTAHAAAVGAERGATVATLQSTEAGFGVYRRLGFETVVDYAVWGHA